MSGKVHDLTARRKRRQDKEGGGGQPPGEQAASMAMSREGAKPGQEEGSGEQEELRAAEAAQGSPGAESDADDAETAAADPEEAVAAGEGVPAQGREARIPGGEAPPEGEDSGEAERLQAALAEAEAQHKEILDRFLRLQADFENYRRRTRHEMERIREMGHEQLAKDLLPVLDNLERALSAAEERSEDDPLASGVRMVVQQLQGVLEQHGITPIPGEGEPFDPHIHEAVERVDASGEAGGAGDAEDDGERVVEELQRGYYLKSKVLRPAMVRVGRGSR